VELTHEQIRDFQAHGYVYAGAVLSEAELSDARAAYDRLMSAESGGPVDRGLPENEGEAPGKVLQVMNCWDREDTFWRIESRPDVVACAGTLMGGGAVRLYSDQALYKPPRHGGKVGWHQDNGYWRLDPATAVSMWLALDDVDEGNGCMWVVPGSHREGLIEHHAPRERAELRNVEVDESDAVPVHVPAGHAMFHHCLTLHGTHSNRTDRPRRAIAITYMPAGATRDGKGFPNLPLLTE
jgi:ectoine hydroxylase-related dioxygenase (phytanoyl-CoA dioxygenase family)